LHSLPLVFLVSIALPLAGLLPATILPAEAAILILPPTITAPPADQTVTVGISATFRVGAGGSEPRQFQWERNGIPIGGATAATYTTPATTLSDNGSTFQVTVTNAGGSVTSTAATLTVSPVQVGGSGPTPPTLLTTSSTSAS